MELDLSQEKKPSRKRLLDKGWRNFKIVGCTDEVKSKKGNNQYILTVQDEATGYEEDLYAVSEPGKRWFLKSILDAVGIKNENGVYQFEPPLKNVLIDKRFHGLVEHEDNTYINRDGVEIKTVQHRINDVAVAEEKAWDDK